MWDIGLRKLAALEGYWMEQNTIRAHTNLLLEDCGHLAYRAYLAALQKLDRDVDCISMGPLVFYCLHQGLCTKPKSRQYLS